MTDMVEITLAALALKLALSMGCSCDGEMTVNVGEKGKHTAANNEESKCRVKVPFWSTCGFEIYYWISTVNKNIQLHKNPLNMT